MIVCKEDIRIGRRLAAVTTKYTIASVALQNVLSPRPDRISVSVCYDAASAAAAANATNISAGPPGGTNVVGVIAAYAWTQLFRLADFGQAVTGSWFLQNQAGGSTIVYVTEVFLTEPLENL